MFICKWEPMDEYGNALGGDICRGSALLGFILGLLVGVFIGIKLFEYMGG